jgi:uncharacterized protein (DUF1778 family)
MGFAVSRQERAAIRRAAKATKTPVSEYVRQRLLEAAATTTEAQEATKAEVAS